MSGPDYPYIRQMERDLGFPLTPLPAPDARTVRLIDAEFSREDWWRDSDRVWALVYKHYPGAIGWANGAGPIYETAETA